MDTSDFSSNSLMYLGNNQRTGYQPARFAPPLKLAWKCKVGDYVWGSAAIIGEQVFLPGTIIRALDLPSGRLIWESAQVNAFGARGLTLDHEFLYVCGASMYAINQQTGELTTLWPHASSGSTPLLNNNTLYWGDSTRSSSYFNAYDLVARQLIWQVDLGHRDPVHASPALLENTIYFSDSFYVYAFDTKTGLENWRRRLVGRGLVTASVALVNNKVLVAKEGPGICALAADSGEVLWENPRPRGPRSGPTVAPDGIVYVAGNRLAALNLESGEEAWSVAGLFDHSAPILVGDYLYIGNNRAGDVEAYERHSGNRVWSYPLGTLIYSTAAYANGHLIIGSHDGFFYCFTQA